MLLIRQSYVHEFYVPVRDRRGADREVVSVAYVHKWFAILGRRGIGVDHFVYAFDELTAFGTYVEGFGVVMRNKHERYIHIAWYVFAEFQKIPLKKFMNNLTIIQSLKW